MLGKRWGFSGIRRGGVFQVLFAWILFHVILGIEEIMI
jgi:hypothetical protein